MTNEEVIEVLEKEESYMLSHGGDRQAKALRIAINKIEQETLPKGQFIAICESDYPITEKVENTLKQTAFVGGDEEEEDMYCFDIKEIIKA